MVRYAKVQVGRGGGGLSTPFANPPPSSTGSRVRLVTMPAGGLRGRRGGGGGLAKGLGI